MDFCNSYHAPPSFHVDEARWNEMLAEGYNSTVIKNFRFRLGNRWYEEGEMPSY